MTTINEILNEIIIDPKLDSYFKRNDAEVKGLEEDILSIKRLTHPITINERPNGDWVLLDGHTRLSICKKHIDQLGDTDVEVNLEGFKTELEEEAAILRMQLNRRNLQVTNALRLKIGEIANKVSIHSRMNNQYSTWVNDPSLSIEEPPIKVSTNVFKHAEEEDKPNNQKQISTETPEPFGTKRFEKKSDGGNVALTTFNLDKMSSNMNIPKRTVKLHAQTFNNLIKLGEAYAPRATGIPADPEFFNVLYEREQLSVPVIKDMVNHMNSLFNEKLKALLLNSVTNPSVDIKRKWERIKSKVNSRPSTTAIKNNSTAIKNTSQSVDERSEVQEGATDYFGGYTEADVSRDLKQIDILRRRIIRGTTITHTDGELTNASIGLYKEMKAIQEHLGPVVISQLRSL